MLFARLGGGPIDPWAEAWLNEHKWYIVAYLAALCLLLLVIVILRIREKYMGGANESVLESDKGNGGKKSKKDEAGAAPPGQGGAPGNMLAPDVVQSAVPANTIPPPQAGWGLPMQTQAIRQHMNNGQVHLHVDAQKLKTAIPVAEWYVIMRHLKSLTPFTFVDPDNKTVAYFRPYVSGGTFEVAIELAAINIGPRITEMTAVTAKK